MVAWQLEAGTWPRLGSRIYQFRKLKTTMLRPASTGTGLKVEPIMKSINLDNFGFVDLLLDH